MEYRTVEGQRDFAISARYWVQLPDQEPEHPVPLLVALHGKGMSAEQFLRLLRHLPERPRILLVPEGPYPFEKRHEQGIDIGYGWYIYRGDQDEFRDHLLRSEQHLLAVLDEVTERFPIDTGRVTLLGYSQGGYLGGFVALRHKQRFAGLVLASTRLKHEFLGEEIATGQLPATLFVHSANDPSVDWTRASHGRDLMKTAGANTEVYLHDSGHRLPAEAVEMIGDWLGRKGLDAETHG